MWLVLYLFLMGSSGLSSGVLVEVSHGGQEGSSVGLSLYGS
jgi:hypothetical protein